jgi:hypothetical protein
MRFETQSGSIYEVDENNKKVRRVAGKFAGTPRVGNDGNWKPYKEITSPIAVGEPVIIVWSVNHLQDSVHFPTTITSIVSAVGELN